MRLGHSVPLPTLPLAASGIAATCLRKMGKARTNGFAAIRLRETEKCRGAKPLCGSPERWAPNKNHHSFWVAQKQMFADYGRSQATYDAFHLGGEWGCRHSLARNGEMSRGLSRFAAAPKDGLQNKRPPVWGGAKTDVCGLR